jgi:adenine-specific DNA-methyltransferase
LTDGESLGTAQAAEAAAALTARAEARRLSALHTVSADQQASLGQFFTPERAAAFIAGLPRLPETGRFQVLDPGAGSGSLAAALAARVLRECPALELTIVAVEIDPEVGRYLQATLTDLTETARAVGVTVATEIVWGDYVELSTNSITTPAALSCPFDLVIMNPPYRKLGRTSVHRRALRQEGVECPNLYAAFIALGATALDPGGQLVAITPRSFANGPYFGQFRRFLLDRLSLDRLHLFESRSTVFSDTGVLQENVVVAGTRQGGNDRVVLSVSRGHTDKSIERVVGYREVVRPGDRQRFIRIVADDSATVIAETMAALPATLPDLNVQVSTGKVVDFRARDNLRKLLEPSSVPLIYPGNVRGGIVEWPREIRKDQGFAVRSEGEQKKFLLPAGFYVVVKRFSAKEERRRVVAAVWDPGRNASAVAFENHLNIFHAHGAGLDRDLAVGLSYWLNSSIVDTFFRTFSGHTQVNATDLRTLRFPPLDAFKALGHGRETLLPRQDEIDRLVLDIMSVMNGVRSAPALHECVNENWSELTPRGGERRTR